MKVEISNLVHNDELAIFLIDIFIRLLLIAGLFYILYKFYFIDTTINNLYNLFLGHANIYLDKIGTLNQIFPLKIVYDALINEINSLNNNRVANKKAADIIEKDNDNNFMAIFISIIVGVFVIFALIIGYTGTYRLLNISNVYISFVFNIIFLIVSQLLFFYFVYPYIDPIQISTIFYYNYLITPPTNLQQIQNQILQKQQITNQQNIVLSQQLLSSKNTSLIFSFMLISAAVFLILAILTVISYLSLYNNVKLPYLVIPITHNTLLIYSLLTFVALAAFIILLLVLLNRVQF
jgi:hypothetical protein